MISHLARRYLIWFWRGFRYLILSVSEFKVVNLIIAQNRYDQVKCDCILILKNCIEQTCLWMRSYSEYIFSEGRWVFIIFNGCSWFIIMFFSLMCPYINFKRTCKALKYHLIRLQAFRLTVETTTSNTCSVLASFPMLNSTFNHQNRNHCKWQCLV